MTGRPCDADKACKCQTSNGYVLDVWKQVVEAEDARGDRWKTEMSKQVQQQCSEQGQQQCSKQEEREVRFGMWNRSCWRGHESKHAQNWQLHKKRGEETMTVLLGREHGQVVWS